MTYAEDRFRVMEQFLNDPYEGVVLEIGNGYKISLDKLGQRRKSYIISVCKPNENMFHQVGSIKNPELFLNCFNIRKK